MQMKLKFYKAPGTNTDTYFETYVIYFPSERIVRSFSVFLKTHFKNKQVTN